MYCCISLISLFILISAQFPLQGDCISCKRGLAVDIYLFKTKFRIGINEKRDVHSWITTSGTVTGFFAFKHISKHCLNKQQKLMHWQFYLLM